MGAAASDPAPAGGSPLYPNTPDMQDDARAPRAVTLKGGQAPPVPAPAPPAEAAPGEPDPAAVAADAFDLPDGFVADPPMMDRFKGVAVRHGLPPAAAKELLALPAEAVAAPAPWRGRETWEAEALALPELREGGDGREALAAVRALADEDVREFLASSGLGNHPQLVRWGLAVGRELRRLRAGGGR